MSALFAGVTVNRIDSTDRYTIKHTHTHMNGHQEENHFSLHFKGSTNPINLLFAHSFLTPSLYFHFFNMEVKLKNYRFRELRK